MRARHVHLAEVNGHNQNFLFVRAGPGKDFAGRSGHKTLSPEFNASASEFFMADAIDNGDVTAIGDSMAALNGFPGVVLVHAIFLFFARMPADGGGIKQDLRALQRGEPRGFGIPLVPANQHADFAVTRPPRLEAEVAGREIKFFIEQRVVGNVHLAVDTEERTIGVNDGGGVVINTGGAFLKERSDDDDLVLFSEFLESPGARAGNRFGKPEILVVLALAKILRTKQLLRADDLSAASGCAFDKRERLFEIRARIGKTSGLNQSDSYGIGGNTFHLLGTLVG